MQKLLLINVSLLLFLTVAQSQTLTVTLTPSNYNGVNVSCFGSQNGSITATVTGGTPPYTYEWSNGENSASINNLAAGYYAVRVIDASPLTDDVNAEITLTQPEPLSMEELTPYVYNNGYNVSAFGACNGTITTNINGGTIPYTYRWEPGQQTVMAPTNLCAQENVLIVTDANGCETNQGTSLREPERDDWTMNGNWGSNPSNQFIGTLDNKDLSFRTNNVERFRIMGNGEIKIGALAGNGERILTADPNGNLKVGPIVIVSTCSTAPNVIAFQQTPGIASDVFTCWRRVGIGTIYPQERLEVKGMARFGAWNASTSFVQIGHDGVDAQGNGGNAEIYNAGNGDLLINYDTQNNPLINAIKNVRICTGNSGIVETGGNTYLATGTNKNVGIGKTTANFKLDVDGTVNATGFKLQGGNSGLLSVDAAGNFVTTPTGNTGLNLWSAIGSDIYNTTTNGNVGIGTSTPNEKLDINGNIRLNNNTVFLRGAADNNHGLAYNGLSNVFTVDGPVLFGWSGGALGSKNTVGDNIALTWNNNGNVGIHTLTTPLEALQIGDRFVIHDGGSKVLGYNFKWDGDNKTLVNGFSSAIYFTSDGNLQFKTSENLTANSVITWATPLTIFNDGYVSIGTDTYDANYILNVCGNIKAEKFLIDADWCDYVFDEKYPLKSINELENFIKKYSRLPNIPSQQEVESKGIEVSEILKLQMEKIEELSLYVIQLNKELSKLKSLVNEK